MTTDSIAIPAPALPADDAVSPHEAALHKAVAAALGVLDAVDASPFNATVDDVRVNLARVLGLLDDPRVAEMFAKPGGRGR